MTKNFGLRASDDRAVQNLAAVEIATVVDSGSVFVKVNHQRKRAIRHDALFLVALRETVEGPEELHKIAERRPGTANAHHGFILAYAAVPEYPLLILFGSIRQRQIELLDGDVARPNCFFLVAPEIVRRGYHVSSGVAKRRDGRGDPRVHRVLVLRKQRNSRAQRDSQDNSAD